MIDTIQLEAEDRQLRFRGVEDEALGLEISKPCRLLAGKTRRQVIRLRLLFFVTFSFLAFC